MTQNVNVDGQGDQNIFNEDEFDGVFQDEFGNPSLLQQNIHNGTGSQNVFNFDPNAKPVNIKIGGDGAGGVYINEEKMT